MGRERRPTGAVPAFAQVVVRYDLRVEAAGGLGRPGDRYRRFVGLMTAGRGDSYSVFQAVKEGKVERRNGLPVSFLVMGDAGSSLRADAERRQKETGLVGDWEGSSEPVVLYTEVPVGGIPGHEYMIRA